MSTRKIPTFRDSERNISRGSVGGSSRICSGDVSDSLTKILREETRLPIDPQTVDGRLDAISHEGALPTNTASIKPLSPTGSDMRNCSPKNPEPRAWI